MELKEHQESLLRILLRETEAKQASEILSGSIFSIFDQHCFEIRKLIGNVFPVFQKTVGEVDFEKLLQEFFADYRPLSSDLREVPQGFFDYFSKHTLASEIPMLVGMAKLELRRFQAGVLPHQNPLSLDHLLQKLHDPESATLSLQAHAQVSTFEYPIFTLWQWAQYYSETDSADENRRIPIEEYAESVLSFRKHSQVHTRKITRTQALILREFRAGKTVAQIEESLSKVDRFFIEQLIEDQLLVVDV